MTLRRTIYLTIQSSLDYEECAHKLLKMQLKPGQEVCYHRMKKKIFDRFKVIQFWLFGVLKWNLFCVVWIVQHDHGLFCPGKDLHSFLWTACSGMNHRNCSKNLVVKYDLKLVFRCHILFIIVFCRGSATSIISMSSLTRRYSRSSTRLHIVLKQTSWGTLPNSLRTCYTPTPYLGRSFNA